MKRYEIDNELTKIVASYLVKGYIINTNSMNGHQGEEGKVDLVKGEELIRVWLERECKFRGDSYPFFGYIMKLRVGRWDYPAIESIKYGRTAWMDDFYILQETDYYQVGTNWYLSDLNEAIRVKDIQEKRLSLRYKNSIFDIRFDGDRYKSLAKNYLKRKVGYKRVSEEDIVVVRKSPLYKEGGHEYYINYKGTTHRLS